MLDYHGTPGIYVYSRDDPCGHPICINLRKAHPDRPFAALRACPERSEWGDKSTHTVMLSAAKHLNAHPDRPFAAAQGDKATHQRNTLKSNSCII